MHSLPRKTKYSPSSLRSLSNADERSLDFRLYSHNASQVVGSDLITSKVSVSDSDDKPIICICISNSVTARRIVYGTCVEFGDLVDRFLNSLHLWRDELRMNEELMILRGQA